VDERAKLLEKKRKAQEELDKIKEEEERLEGLDKETKEDGERIKRREEERKKEDDLAEARRRGLPPAPPRGAGHAPARGDFDRGPPRRDDRDRNWRDDRRPEFDRRDRDFDDRRDYRRDPRDRPSMGPGPRVRPLSFLHIDHELICRHSNHLPTALQTRPRPSLLDFDLHPDAHFRQLAVLDPLPDVHSRQLAVLDPLPDVHFHQWEDQDPLLGHKVIPTDLIGMVRASHHLEGLGIQGRSLLNQCLMRYVSSYSYWFMLMNSRGGRLGNDLLLRG
jgi:hypothetical protein